MNVSREEAIEFISYLRLFETGLQEREDILMDSYSENDAYEAIDDFYSEDFNGEIRKYLKRKLIGIKNEYLQGLINKFTNSSVTVNGKVEELSVCPCCNFKSLESNGQYEICKVCFWEDDGSYDLDKYSSPNHMTLRKAKLNFQQYGAIDKKFISKVIVKPEEVYLT